MAIILKFPTDQTGNSVNVLGADHIPGPVTACPYDDAMTILKPVFSDENTDYHDAAFVAYYADYIPIPLKPRSMVPAVNEKMWYEMLCDDSIYEYWDEIPDLELGLLVFSATAQGHAKALKKNPPAGFPPVHHWEMLHLT
jgi:hypothetical protein